MSAEGSFVPAVGAKSFGVGANTSISEASRTFANKVVTTQTASLRLEQNISFSAMDVSNSDIYLLNNQTIEFIAGMMVQNVVKTVLESDMLSSQKSKWISENTASAEGVTFDFMGALLAPLVVVVCLGLFAVTGGPMVLKKLASKHLLLFAALVLVGSIVGMVVSSNIGGYIASGVGISVALYLFYLVWKLKTGSRADAKGTPHTDTQGTFIDVR
jgi:hypothetical protein